MACMEVLEVLEESMACTAEAMAVNSPVHSCTGAFLTLHSLISPSPTTLHPSPLTPVSYTHLRAHETEADL
eukprot:2034475-Rhodomonas_salina.1